MGNNINFQFSSFGEAFSTSAWTITPSTGGSITNGILTLNTGATASCSLSASVNDQFAYYKVTSAFSSSGGLPESDFFGNKAGLYLAIQEVYQANGSPLSTRTRAVALLPNPVSGSTDSYTSSTVLSTLNTAMSSMQVVIVNNTGDTVTVSSLNLYQSVDIPISQVNGAYNSLAQQSAAQSLTVYRNADGSINGLAVTIPGSSTPIKFQPVYFNGQISSINFSNGSTTTGIPIVNLQQTITLP